ncbi:Malic acid transport protein [Teratosphaeria destructans]|uniref:Malic acid transport protein n=1 Tax=Teratosphaeria destructans TaxID=418781 RepID=A0A9W7SVT7_9PEZI|nr:Malic acid transport protein [Teratosphaeria destructans]
MELPLYRRRQQSSQSENDHLQKGIDEQKDGQVLSTVPLTERVKHVTWANFTFPMSTGGIALLLHTTPHKFRGLYIIGKIFFIFDLVIFLAIAAAITTRFVLGRQNLALQSSLAHPTEGLFFPTSLLALFDVFALIQTYGVPTCGPWLIVVVRVLFWIYVAVTFISAVWQYWYLFTAPKRLTLHSMTPAWLLPTFPVMLCGTLASLIVSDQPDAHRLPIAIAGTTFQGLGWMISFMMFSIYVHRLMQYGLPAPNLRPGMFIAVGPPSFTGIALMGITNGLPQSYEYFARHPNSVEILQIVALFAAIFLWSLALWFFFISLLSVLAGVKQMSFHLVWWALVFPNTGWTIATINIGNQLESQGILWIGSAMTIILVATWTLVFIMEMRAIFTKQIAMPGQDEDADQYTESDKKAHIPTPPSRPPSAMASGGSPE